MSCNNLMKKELYGELDVFIESLDTRKGNLITVLHRAQEIFGYLPVEVQKFVAERMDTPLAEVYGVITFYSFFTTKPRGKYPISVCMGTACYVNGAQNILTEIERDLQIKVGETSDDGRFSIDVLRCVGACGMAPVIMVGNKIHGKIEAENITALLKEYK